MRKYFFFILVVSSATCFLSVKPISAQILGVPSVLQQESEWCWAGCSNCIMQYFHDTVPQCDIAEYARTRDLSTFGTKNCCSYPGDSCNNPNYIYSYPGSIQDILSHYKNISSTGWSSDLTLFQVQQQITNGTPFVIRWGWYSGGGHFLVGYGIRDTNVYYMDPLAGYSIGGYDWVVNNDVHLWNYSLTLDTTVEAAIPSLQETAGNIMVYPNPSNGTATFNYTVKTSGPVSIIISNMLGQVVSTPLNKKMQPPGMYTLAFDENGLTAGVYLYTFTSGQSRQTGKIIISGSEK